MYSSTDSSISTSKTEVRKVTVPTKCEVEDGLSESSSDHAVMDVSVKSRGGVHATRGLPNARFHYFWYTCVALAEVGFH